ncbi:MAG: hypothetical protein JWP69_2340 [Flaviaesturariibacter sp.]|nr:hypothetical protein [Flaviaesturariibacter sp.]
MYSCATNIEEYNPVLNLITYIKERSVPKLLPATIFTFSKACS